jgi:4-amino-4-deoxy-L-arabinose transferase-like glycosyltransferase
MSKNVSSPDMNHSDTEISYRGPGMDGNSMKGNVMFEKISQFSDNKKGLYLALLVSLLIKAFTLIIMDDMAINRDGTQYIAAAKQFAQGNFMQGFVFHSMPLYSLIIAIVNFVIRDWLLSARLISIGALVLAVIPLYLITKDLFGRKAAFWGCLAFSFVPEVNQLAMEVLRDSVFIFCLLWSIYFAQRAIQKKELIFFFLAAFFSWVPILFRIEGVIFSPFYFLFLGSLLCIFMFMSKQEGLPYLKGMIIWIAWSLFIVAVFWITIGPEFISFNKLDKVTDEAHKIYGFRVGESYNRIYTQLKMLESMSTYPSGNQNFAEVARHFMPLIYMIGFIEILAKNVFVFFLIPFIWGLRSTFFRSHMFLITFVGCYLLAIFYTYIERDFIQTRFLLAPAILLFPWIGLGIQKILSRVEASAHSKLLLVICVIAFILMPLGKFTKTMAGEERVIRQAGEWIKRDPKFQNVTFYANDSRIAFHAGWSRKEFENIKRKYKRIKRNQEMTLEQFGIENNIDLIALKISKKKLESAPAFTIYRELKELEGKKKNIFIYCSPALCEKFNM